jgi:hypothetical protein
VTYTPTCSSCGQAMIWARLDGGWEHLDRAGLEPAPGRVAYNPRSGRAHVLRPGELEEARRWATAGVTFHARHTDVCDARAASGQRRGQAELFAQEGRGCLAATSGSR